MPKSGAAGPVCPPCEGDCWLGCPPCPPDGGGGGGGGGPLPTILSIKTRPEIRRDYPLNLSILVSGGKETNKDSLSNGE